MTLKGYFIALLAILVLAAGCDNEMPTATPDLQAMVAQAIEEGIPHTATPNVPATVAAQVQARLAMVPTATPYPSSGVATPTPASVGAYLKCGPDSELGGGFRRIRGKPVQYTMKLGFRCEESGADIPIPHESRLIAGDLSIIDVTAVVHYAIHDLEALVSDGADPEAGPDGLILRFAAQSALSEVVGRHNRDGIFTSSRLEIEHAVRDRLQEILYLFGDGVRVQYVALQDVRAPEAVRPAFDDELRARQDRDTTVNQARNHENAAIPQAHSEARRIIESAETARDIRLAGAEEEVRRFVSTLKEYNGEKDSAFRELHLKTMEDILPGVAEFMVAGAQSKNSAGDNLGASQQYISMTVMNPVAGQASRFNGIASSTTGPRVHAALRSTSREKPLNSRLFLVDPTPIETVDTDKNKLEVDVYAVIRIVEPAQIEDFSETVSQLANISNAALMLEIAGRTLSEVIGAAFIFDALGVPVTDENGLVQIRATNSRSEIMDSVMGRVNARVNKMGLGVEVVDLRIKSVGFPKAVVPAIFARMRTEQQRISARFRADGEEKATRIRANADRQRALILAEAQREAAVITGEGESAIIDAALEILTQDPELLVYEKALRAYRVSRGHR